MVLSKYPAFSKSRAKSSRGGTFTVSSLELAAAGSPQVVKVRPNSGDTYYLSLRSGVGYDASMPSSTTYLNKLNVHRYGGSGNTRFITALGDGQAFNDAASGISIQQLSRTADSATFQVSTTCVAQAPTATISPSSQGAGATLPATRSYTVTVSNRDSPACSSSTFALASSLPGGWSGGFSTPTLTIAAGASASATEIHMCRSIKQLRNVEVPATDEELRAAALQFVRKVSGYRKPSRVNEAAFERAVEQVAQATRILLTELKQPPVRHGN